MSRSVDAPLLDSLLLNSSCSLSLSLFSPTPTLSILTFLLFIVSLISLVGCMRPLGKDGGLVMMRRGLEARSDGGLVIGATVSMSNQTYRARKAQLINYILTII